MVGGEITDKEIKEYVDSEILRTANLIEGSFEKVSSDIKELQKRIEKLEKD